MRVEDATPNDFRKFAHEQGMKNTAVYAQWWSEKIAKTIAKMHVLRKAHGCPHCGNLTIDGVLVDNDSVHKSSLESDMYDLIITHNVVNRLTRQKLNLFLEDASRIRRNFLSIYAENCPEINEDEFKALYKKLRKDWGKKPVIPIREPLEDLFEDKFGRKLEC